MTIRNLEFAFSPRSVAVFGASERPGSVGDVVMRNILAGGFAGEIFPVNPKYATVHGLRCHADTEHLPHAPDLAVIVTPPETVPGLIDALGRRGTRTAVVITAGLTASNGLKTALLKAAEPYLFRIIGPNTVGLILPHVKLNASFSHISPHAGGVALLSQSGAIVTSLIDWAEGTDIGFSSVVSLGDMADVDAADCLDMLAGDADTRAIVMYLESIPNPPKFMSAARAAARVKPVIAIKPGRHAAAAKAAATHTGALSGADRVTDAALRRAGILRVSQLHDLFDATETIARFSPLERVRTAIVTNGGGAGVLAVDRLMDWKGELAELHPDTIAALDEKLPGNWSKANPVDIIGDAPAERYRTAVEIVARDPGVDALIVMNCPTGLASPTQAAGAVASIAERGRIGEKPVLACWLGEKMAREDRELLHSAGIASFESPEAVADAAGYLGEWSRAQRALTRVPQTTGEHPVDAREKVLEIFRKVANEGRSILTEPEAKAAVAAYGITVPETRIAKDAEEVRDIASAMLADGGRLVVKLLSRTLTHKSDLGGVILNIETPAAAYDAAQKVVSRLDAAGKLA